MLPWLSLSHYLGMRNIPFPGSETWLWVACIKWEAEIGLKSRIITGAIFAVLELVSDWVPSAHSVVKDLHSECTGTWPCLHSKCDDGQISSERSSSLSQSCGRMDWERLLIFVESCCLLVGFLCKPCSFFSDICYCSVMGIHYLPGLGKLWKSNIL